MASLNTLPTEILEKIIMNIPGRPFKTELLLLNKALCYLFMAEQVRNLELLHNQLTAWITIITSNDAKTPCSELRYRNVLNKMVKLSIGVSISGRNITEEEMGSFISHCSNLRILILQRRDDSYYLRWNISIIFSNLPSNIIEIFYSGFKYRRDIRALINYAKRNTKLKTLQFDHSKIGPGGTRVLVKFLKQNMALTNLNISHNHICSEGAIDMAESLMQNTTLTHLNLEGNQIEDKGVHSLAEALMKNSVITNLCLSMNYIGDEGACSLAKALKQNTTLINLDISQNRIYLEGAHSIAKALKQNTSLKNLNLEYNYFDIEKARDLIESLNENLTVIL